MATMLLRQYKERLAARGRDLMGRAKQTMQDIRPGAADAAAAADRAYLGRLQAEAQRRHPDLAPEVTCFADVHGAHGGGAMWVAGPPPASLGTGMMGMGGMRGGVWGGVWGGGGGGMGGPAAEGGGGGDGGDGAAAAAAAHYPPVLAADLDIVGASAIDAMCGSDGSGGGGEGGSGGGSRVLEASLLGGMGLGGDAALASAAGAAAGRYPAVGSDAFADASPTAWGMPYGVEPIQGVSMYDSHPPGGSDTYDKGSPPSALASSSGGGGGTIGGAGATAFALSPHGGPKAPASAFQGVSAAAGAVAAARLSLEEAQRVAADALAASALAVSLFPDDNEEEQDESGLAGSAAAGVRVGGRHQAKQPPAQLQPSSSLLRAGGGGGGGGSGSGGASGSGSGGGGGGGGGGSSSGGASGFLGTAASVGSKLRASLRRQFSTGGGGGGTGTGTRSGSGGGGSLSPPAVSVRGTGGAAGGGPPHVAVAAAVLPAANPAAAQAPGCQSPPAASLPEEPPSAVAPATHQAPPPLVSAFAASLGRGGRKAATTTPSRLGLRAQPQVPVQPQAGVDAGAQGVAGAEPLRFRPAALQLPGSARAEKAGDSDPEFFSPARSSVALFGTPGCSTPHGSPGPVSPTAHQPPWVGSSHASPAPSPAAHQSQGCAAAAHATAGGAAGFNGVQQPSRFARMNSARDAASSSPGGFAQPTAAAATAPGYRNAEQQSQLLNGRGSSGGGGLLKSLGSWRSGIGAGLQEGSPSRGGQPPRRQPQPGPQEQSHHDYDFSDLLDNQD